MLLGPVLPGQCSAGAGEWVRLAWLAAAAAASFSGARSQQWSHSRLPVLIIPLSYCSAVQLVDVACCRNPSGHPARSRGREEGGVGREEALSNSNSAARNTHSLTARARSASLIGRSIITFILDGREKAGEVGDPGRLHRSRREERNKK